MIKRREFIEKQLKLGLGFTLLGIPKKGLGFDLSNETNNNLFFKLSLIFVRIISTNLVRSFFKKFGKLSDNCLIKLDLFIFNLIYFLSFLSSFSDKLANGSDFPLDRSE